MSAYKFTMQMLLSEDTSSRLKTLLDSGNTSAMIVLAAMLERLLPAKYEKNQQFVLG